jgi:glycosyltransferase involved in cell wall biosynthesis
MHVAFISMRYPRNDKEFVRIYERKLVRYLKEHADLSILSWSLHRKEQPFEMDGFKIDMIPVIDYSRIQRLYDNKFGFGASFLDAINDMLKVWGTTYKIHKLHRKKPVDVILAASFSVSAFYPALISKLKRIPLVTQSFGFDVSVVDSIGYGQRSRLNRQRMLSSMALKAACAIAPNSKGLAEDTVLAEHMDKVKVVYHGVDTKEYNRNNLKPQASKSGTKKRKLTVLNVGGLRPVKGWRHIFDAAEKLKSYDIEFIIIGGDDELDEFNKLVKTAHLENIRYLGKVSHKELFEHYYNADVFFMPSLSEGLPNAMLEAAAMELALLGSGKGGIRDIIVNGKNGYFIREPDPEKFAEKILHLYNNPVLLGKMKKNARKHMKDKFKWETNVKELVNLFEELVAK